MQTPCHVVLVAYHGQAWLPACLASLQHATTADTLLTLVDNAGEHDLSSLPSVPFQCEIIKTPRPMGFAEANNFALARSAGSHFATCLLNQDTISQPGWLDTCMAMLEKEPGVGAVSPVLRTYDGNAFDPGFLEILPPSFRGEAGMAQLQQREFVRTQAVTGAAMVMRSDVLRRVGPFDPIYGSYYEDFDLCARIRLAGYEVGICTTADVRHFSGSATRTRAQQIKRARLIIRNKEIYAIRFGHGSRSRRTAGCLLKNLPYRLVRSLLRTPSSQPPSAVMGAAADLCGLLPRLVSSARDEREWRTYLRSISW